MSLADHVDNSNVFLWLRIAALAEREARENGHAPMQVGELRRLIDPTISVPQYSNAIRAAIKAGFLEDGSNARCLMVPGADPDDCSKFHRMRSRR